MNLLFAGFQILLGLLPVFAFLLALILLDSFKLVKLRTVALLIVAGGLVGGEHHEALLLQHAPLLIDGLVLFDDLPRQSHVLASETVDGLAQGRAHGPAHLQDTVPQLLALSVYQ